MPGPLATLFSPSEIVTLALLTTLVFLLGAIGVRAWRGSRVSREDLERRRRTALVAGGKISDANLVEIREEYLFFYSYEVRGVEYTASQDVSHLREFLPPGLLSAVGPVYVKYDPRNPANSIILSEQWSGLRNSRSRP